MQEDFLHHLWKHKKIPQFGLKTANNQLILVKSFGQHNLNSGPDFFNAQIQIENQLWAGNVEMHIKSSDWYVHNHEIDKAYDNVILHVVWEHDVEVFRRDKTVVPTLQLSNYIDQKLLETYSKLFNKNGKWINCEQEFAMVDSFVLNNWLERLYFERLEQKSVLINNLLKQNQNDWEAVLFILLAKNFGLKVNGESFFELASSINFSIIRKLQSNLKSLEALLFGQGGLLEDAIEDSYYIELQNEYQFLKNKFNIKGNLSKPVQFFRLRPQNFPTIRLSQFASFYFKNKGVFSRIIETHSLEEFYTLFDVETSYYWRTHYTFKTESKLVAKKLTKSFIDLVLINTILPVKFCYSQHQGQDINAIILEVASQIKSESNAIINGFNKLKNVAETAIDSQALLQLKNEYCSKNKCLQCAVGAKIISN